MTWTGALALRRRQASSRGDNTGLQSDQRTSLEHRLPAGTDVKVNSIENLEDYEKPLTVKFQIKGPVGSSASAAFPLIVRREFDLGNIIYTTAEYPGLRAFYNKLETKDPESAVLKAAAPAASGN